MQQKAKDQHKEQQESQFACHVCFARSTRFKLKGKNSVSKANMLEKSLAMAEEKAMENAVEF